MLIHPATPFAAAPAERPARRCGAGILLTLLLMTGANAARAQAGTDVFIAMLRQEGRAVSIGSPVNVTRRPGSDDRPSFAPDGASLVYTSIDRDGRAAAWAVPVTGGVPVRAAREALALGGVDPASDHVWVDRTVFIRVTGDPATLHMVDTTTGKATVIARGIGPGLVKVPHHGALNFVQVVPDGGHWLAEYTVSTAAVRRLGRLPPGAGYAAWTPRGALLTAAGSVIYRWDDGTWVVAADLGAGGVRNISRIVVNAAGDRLAFVADDAR